MPLEAFKWTENKQTVQIWTAVAPAIAALVVALVIIGLAVVIHANPRTRCHLRRQSLKMLLCVQLASLVYSITYIGEMLIKGRTVWCNVCITLTLATSNFIDFVVMLIPVNLQTALVHGISTEGWVRWYLGGSFLAAVITAVPGAARDVWGWDELTRICWIKIQDSSERNAWQIGAFYAWILLSMVVATISTAVVVTFLLTHARATDRKFITSRFSSSSSGHIFRAVAWRVMVYPLILIINNTLSAAGNFLITSADGIHSWKTYCFWVVSGVSYGAVPLLYGFVILFIDPSFNRALRELFVHTQRPASWRGSSIELGGSAPVAIEFARHVTTRTDIDSLRRSVPPTFTPTSPTASYMVPKHLDFTDFSEGVLPKSKMEGRDDKEDNLTPHQPGSNVSPHSANPPSPLARRPTFRESFVRRELEQTRLKAELDQL